MFDRHFVGDVALAVLFAIPVAALARPDPVRTVHKPAAAAAAVQQAPVISQQDRPVSLLR